jgi:hypothetical protein
MLLWFIRLFFIMIIIASYFIICLHSGRLKRITIYCFFGVKLNLLKTFGFLIHTVSLQGIMFDFMTKQFKDTRPLTKAMTDVLMDFHEREIMNMPSSTIGNSTIARYLIERKLLTTRVFKRDDGENVIRVYTTQLGRDYLNIKK